MQSKHCIFKSFLVVIIAMFAVRKTIDSAQSAERKALPASRIATAENAAEYQNVELFHAIEAGDVEVTLIPKDSKQSTVLLKNKSNKPLRIKMPEAFVGVPLLAQRFDEGDDRGDRDRGGDSSNQSVGGGLGGGGFGGGGIGGGGGGGFFNIQSDSVRKIKVATVCLEHGRPDPKPRVRYSLKPIETFTKDKMIIELCKMLGRREIDQHAAQAAVWHLTDSLSWQQLASKPRVRHLNGSVELWFGQRDLHRANQILMELKRRLTVEMKETKSPGEIDIESL